MKKNPFSSDENFLNEKSFFNTNSFILVGHKCEFKKQGDFKTLNFYEKSIVVYKFKEKI